MLNADRPLPVVNKWAEPFWKAAKQNVFTIQKCKACGSHIFIPRICCPECFSDELDWVVASGKGTVYSYTVVYNNAPSRFQSEMPFVIAIVRLDEGGQMLTNIVGCDPSEVKCDMRVEVQFEKLNDEFNLPLFRPISQ
jgi:hypothetical protein